MLSGASVAKKSNDDVLMPSPMVADTDFYRKKARIEGRVTTTARGVMGHPETTADPTFYIKKRAAEAEVGRALTTEEFLRDHYKAPETPIASGTSIFDPVLCELAYRWFSPAGGVVLDPFAGGSVRGIVASVLGRRYVGVDLRAEQVEANREQAAEICDLLPEWHVGDSAEVIPGLDVEADLVFSCPPYADLEVYSDDPRDLSTMDYPSFVEAYRRIIAAACSKLKPNAFAVFVVGEVRDRRGNYLGFVPDTIAAFRDAGLAYYNEAILVTAAGSLPIRAGRQFETTRKIGKTHQNVLVFTKGDPKKATAAIGPVEFGEIAAVEGGED